MKNPFDIASVLRTALVNSGQTQLQLRERAGVSQRTLTNVLSGQQDFRVSTLMALADRLGLELLLVPKGAAPVLDTGAVAGLAIRSRVQAALDRAAEPNGGTA